MFRWIGTNGETSEIIQQTGYMDVKESRELEDGIVFWKDDILYNLEQGSKTEDAERDAAQITFRQEGMPYPAHFVLCAQKRSPTIGALDLQLAALLENR